MRGKTTETETEAQQSESESSRCNEEGSKGLEKTNRKASYCGHVCEYGQIFELVLVLVVQGLVLSDGVPRVS